MVLVVWSFAVINHARTLLINQSRSEFPVHGEELIPKPFLPVAVPASVTRCRSILFGTNPDRFMLNYRTAQLLRLLHISQFKEDILALDPRITYEPFDASWVSQDLFKPEIAQRTGPQGSVVWGGSPSFPDQNGVTTFVVDVTVHPDGSVTVQPFSPPGPTLSRGPSSSQPIPLGESGYTFVSSSSVGASWSITIRNRPRDDPSMLLKRLKPVSVDELFIGTMYKDVLNRCRDAYLHGWDDVEKLSAVVCAMIYQTEIARVSQHGSP